MLANSKLRPTKPKLTCEPRKKCKPAKTKKPKSQPDEKSVTLQCSGCKEIQVTLMNLLIMLIVLHVGISGT